MDDWDWIASVYNNLFYCAVSSLAKVNTFLSRMITVREFVSALSNFCEVIRHLGSCALLAAGFTSDLKLFYLPRSCLHTETKRVGEGNYFPYSTLDGVYVSVNPHSARAACRFPAKFSRDPGNYERCGAKEG